MTSKTFGLLASRELTQVLVERAERAGYTALVLTVDLLGSNVRTRERELRLRYGSLDAGRAIKNLVTVDLPNVPTIENFADSIELALSWSDVAWLRSITTLPLVIKGIQTAEDARLCVEQGVDGLVVSNHGAQALSSTQGSIEMLPEVVDAVGGRVEVYLDSGVRRGTDVLKSLALGAKAVFIGRPLFWGLAAWPPSRGGADDVAAQLERLAELVERGYLTMEEFQAQKARLLDQRPPDPLG